MWRVACVRIPRFPIGAVWHGTVDGGNGQSASSASSQQQLALPLDTPSTSTRDTTRDTTDPRSPLARAAGAAAPSRTSAAHPSDRTDDAADHASDALHWDLRLIALVDAADGDEMGASAGARRDRLRAVTAAAGRTGVRAGMRVAEARARCAALDVRTWDVLAIQRAIDETTAALLVASPQVTPVAGAPGMWWVGASGLDALGGERALARTLLRIARVWHPGARVAIADSCVAARVGTWGDVASVERGGGSVEGRARNSVGSRRSTLDAPPVERRASSAESRPIPGAVFVPRGGCAAYLAPAPLGFVPMEDEIRQTLQALGIRTVGAFASLDAADVERRWGPEGMSAWRLARGDDARRPVLARPESKRMVTAELAMPTAVMEPALFLVRAALDRLARGLVADGRAAAAIAITLTLDDGRGALPAGGIAHTVTREVRFPRPMARVAPLFERCRALLDRWSLDAPVCGVSVAIVGTAPAPAEQGDLLSTSWRDPAAADAAFARLRAELGPNVVVRPIAADNHRPEREGAWVGDEGDGKVERREGAHASASPLPPPLSLRLLESPERADVQCVEDAPRIVWWRGRRIPVAHASGPERLTGEWWAEGYRRDYWRCESEEGELLLFRDYDAPSIETRDGARPTPRGTAQLQETSQTSNWFVHGWYD
jgi:protein ImuB